jgi:hypothetical protein
MTMARLSGDGPLIVPALAYFLDDLGREGLQIAASGFLAVEKSFTNATASSSARE